MHFLLDPVLRQLTLRQRLRGELEEVHHLVMQLARLGRDTAPAEQLDAGRPDIGPVAVGPWQPPQVGYDLRHAIGVERWRLHVEPERIRGPRQAGETQQHADLGLVRALEDGCLGVEAQQVRRPAQVRLEDLADVHPARHPERVEHDVHRRPVGEERHILLRHDRAMMPLLPWRPAILSPTEIFRFSAT